MRKHLRYTTVLTTAVALFFLQPGNAQNTSPYWSLKGNSNATTTSKLGTTNSVSLRFYSGNVQRMLIGYSSGNVAIGTTLLTHRLTVGGNGRFTTGLQVDDGGLQVTNSESGSVGISGNGALIGVSGSGSLWGVLGGSSDGAGVSGQSNSFTGVTGFSTSGVGTAGESSSNVGVYALSQTAAGIEAHSTDSYGGNFISENHWGLRAQTTNGTYAGVFYGKVWSSGGYVTSDKNLKQNVREFSNAMSIINKLKPRNYEFKTDAKYAFLKLAKGNHYGLLAQDVEEVLPELVATSPHEVMKTTKPLSMHNKAAGVQPASEKPETISLKAVNYTELIPIMIKGMQEQNNVIEKLLQRIDDLESQVTKLKTDRGATTTSGILGQNTPNPAKGSTRISYTLPVNTGQAQLLITDGGGKTVKSISLNKTGIVDVNTAALSSGVYQYSVVADGRILETKKLTVTRE